MTDMVENNVEELFLYLTNKENSKKSNIIKIHTKNLENGEYSFPTSINSWRYYLNDKHEGVPKCNLEKLFENSESFISGLIKASEEWTFKIDRISLMRDHCFLNLNRDLLFRLVISDVLKHKESYGFVLHNTRKHIHISHHGKSGDEITLTDLRLNIVSEVCKNFISKLGHVLSDSPDNVDLNVCFAKNIQKNTNTNTKIIQCGVVTAVGKSKGTNVFASDLKQKRSTQMQLLAQHKYGVRFADNSKSMMFSKQLGESSVKFEMLQVKLSKPLNVNTENHASCSSKGVSFILYNYARISSIRDEFEKKVNSGFYPKLPDFEDIDCSVYKDDMEWELLFCYVLRFPSIVKECSYDIVNGAFNPHYLCNFLSALVGIFSVYYRNVKILVTRHEHMTPVIHSRMFLLIAIDYVLRNGLALLTVPPVNHM